MSQKRLQIHILGELSVIERGQLMAVPGSRKTRALMAYLLLQKRPVTREHLCELLWPRPDNPRAALRWSLTKLRPLLREGELQHLVAGRSSVAIEGLDDCVDLLQVDSLLTKPIDEIATTDLEAAAELFRGELLEGMEVPDCHRFNEWLMVRSEAARKARRTILETLTARLAGDPERALVHARARVSFNPLDEGAHVDVVRLLGALGRRTEAKEQAGRCREVLESELGVAPGPELAEALRGMKTRVSPAPAISASVVRVEPRVAVETGLFGRAEECVRLESFLAANGRRPILFLEGEPGIGKSRLLAELRRRAEIHGILVLMGRSWEVEMVRPFGVWIDLLAGLQHEMVPVELRTDLAPLLPSLGEPLPHEGQMERLLGAVEGLVESFDQAGQSVVFVFDDIHWIDQASVELLNYISLRQRERHLGIACAGRLGEFADNESVRSLVRGWNRAAMLERVSVEPLPDRDAAALARSWSESADVEAIVASCGGNPLYLIESAREGNEKDPGKVASLIADRLTSLDEPTRAIARWAAVLGHAFPAARMADLLSQPLADLLTRTEALELHGILRSHGDEWDFAHDLLRRATLAGLSGPRRTLMHRRIARAMVAEPDPDGALAGELAFHAGRGGEPELAAAAAVSAGDRALRLAAFADAWRIADRGLIEVAKLPDESSIEVHVELLRVLVLASMGRRRGQAINEDLVQLARRAHAAGLHAAERSARWLLSVVTEEAGDFDAARQHSLHAEEASRRADPQTRLRALANTARCLMQLEREPVRAAVLLNEARGLAEILQTQVIDIPWGLGLLCAMEGREEEARVALGRGAVLARDESNHWARFECLSRISMLDLTAGDLAAVEGRDGELREVAEKLGEGSERALAATLLALARRQGGNEGAELDLALAELRAADSKGLLAYALIETGRLELADGDILAARGRAEEALKASTDVGRHHQYDRAMLLMTRAALIEGDEETTDRFIQWLDERLEHLSPDFSTHRDLRQLREDITNQRNETL